MKQKRLSCPPHSLMALQDLYEKDRLIKSLGRGAQTEFRGKDSDEAFEKFIGYLAGQGKERTDARQAADGFKKWRARRDVLNDPRKYHEMLEKGLGAEASKRFRNRNEAVLFGDFIAKHGDDPGRVEHMKLYLNMFRDRSISGCAKAIQAAFPRDFKTKFLNGKAVQVFAQQMIAKNLHADSTPQEVREFYRDYTAAKMLAMVARQTGDTRVFTPSQVSLFIDLMNKEGYELEDSRAAAKVLPEFLLLSPDPRPRFEHTSSKASSGHGPHDEQSESRGRSERSGEMEPDRRARDAPLQAGAAYRWPRRDQKDAEQTAQAPRKRLASRSPTNLNPSRRKSTEGSPALSEHEQQILRERETWEGRKGPVPWDAGPVPLEQDRSSDFNQMAPALRMTERAAPVPGSPAAGSPSGTPEIESEGEQSSE